MKAPGAPHRLMIVDDHPIVRHGIAQLLAGEPDLRCDLEADNAEDALRLLRQHAVALLIADISLPGLSGLDLTRRVVATWPALPVLVLSMHEESAYADRAFSAGARGYVNKHGATDELVKAVRRLLEGGLYFGAAFERQVLDRMRGPAEPAPVPARALGGLNEREYEVLQMLAQGLSSAEMAERINRSVKSVEVYRASLRQKLHARTVAELTRIAIEVCRPGAPQ